MANEVVLEAVQHDAIIRKPNSIVKLVGLDTFTP
jgi:hypothetical protein